MTTSSCAPKLNLVVLISGRGSNLQSIQRAIEEKRLNANILAVISNNESAAGLDYASTHGIATHTLSHKAFSDRLSFDRAMMAIIDNYQPDLIVLAGFMRLLTDAFVNRYLGKLINIHPSLLPAYAGLNTHQRALDDGAKVHGASVHFVTPELDGGPVIAQVQIPIYPEDDADRLAARVLKEEHRLYPAVIDWFCQGRLSMANHAVIFDGTALQRPILLEQSLVRSC